LLIMRQSKTILFPYTTLFRSRKNLHRNSLIKDFENRMDKWKIENIDQIKENINIIKLNNDNFKALKSENEMLEKEVEDLKKEIIDRKSTRLNSSHDQISYAVF